MPGTDPAAGLRSNADQLVTTRCFAEVVHPQARAQPAIDWQGVPSALPGMAGVARNLRGGSPALGWACDHGEPGASVGSRDPHQHRAVQVLAALGNTVRVLGGGARGAVGTVIGKHAYVLCDFEGAALERMAPGDPVVIEAVGQGLRLADHGDVQLRNCSPRLLAQLRWREAAGRLQFAVRGVVPPELMGAGLGMSSEWANCDVMLQDPALREAHRLHDLCIGDLVAMAEQDHRFGRGYRRGWAAIGVVVHALSPLPGHGVGVVTLATGPTARLGWWIDPGATIAAAATGVGAER